MLNVVTLEINVALITPVRQLDTPVVELKDHVGRQIRSAVMMVAVVHQHHMSVVAVAFVATQLPPERVAAEISTALGTRRLQPNSC